MPGPGEAPMAGQVLVRPRVVRTRSPPSLPGSLVELRTIRRLTSFVISLGALCPSPSTDVRAAPPCPLRLCGRWDGGTPSAPTVGPGASDAAEDRGPAADPGQARRNGRDHTGRDQAPDQRSGAWARFQVEPPVAQLSSLALLLEVP